MRGGESPALPADPWDTLLGADPGPWLLACDPGRSTRAEPAACLAACILDPGGTVTPRESKASTG